MSKKTKQKTIQTEDSIEALKRLPSDFKSAVTSEGKNIVSDLWKQVLKPGAMYENQASSENSGELKPGEEVDLRKIEKQPQLQAIEPGINYAREIIEAGKHTEVKEQQQTKVRIQEIIIEIKRLTKSSKELAIQFKDVEKMEQMPANAGKYHTNFVEWVLSMIKSAREKVDNTLAWTTALKSKKSQKQYWALFKKHGTSFALSTERYAVTQTG